MKKLDSGFSAAVVGNPLRLVDDSIESFTRRVQQPGSIAELPNILSLVERTSSFAHRRSDD